VTDWIPRRHPGCGSETAHGPHGSRHAHRRDGTVLAPLGAETYCAGWTPAEADACVLLGQVHDIMLTSTPDGTGAGLRLEIHPAVSLALAGLLLPGSAARLRDVEVLVSPSLPAGGWRLIRLGPELASGTVR
jgi:hypothetical protein